MPESSCRFGTSTEVRAAGAGHLYGTSLPVGGESFTVEPHDGEEFGYVVEGSVVLGCDGEEHPLRRGETFYLHGRSFHLLKNVRKTTTRVLWVSTPPLF